MSITNNKTKRQETQEANLKAALSLIAIGIAIFPANPNKTPCLNGWQRKATCDEKLIRKFWKKFPHAIPAIPTGRINNIAVLDIDTNVEKKKRFRRLASLWHRTRHYFLS